MQTINKKLKTPSSQGFKCQAIKRAAVNALICHHNKLQEQAVSALCCQQHMAWPHYNPPLFFCKSNISGKMAKHTIIKRQNTNIAVHHRFAVIKFAGGTSIVEAQANIKNSELRITQGAQPQCNALRSLR